VGFLSNIFMIGVGGYSILTGGGFTVGEAARLPPPTGGGLFGPIQTLARWNDWSSGRGAARRVFEVARRPRRAAGRAPGAGPS